MVSLRFPCQGPDRELLLAELSLFPTTGILESDEGLEVFFEQEEAALQVARSYVQWRPQFVRHPPRDWVAEFQSFWKPVAIGKRLWLAPPWDTAPPPSGRIRLDYQPGMSCGSGAHVCTQLCLEALEEELKPGDAVLDVGVGSGLVLAAAELLGAGLVAGCDLDEQAIRYGAGAVASRRLLFLGSADAVRPSSFDLVVVNISAPAMDSLLDELKQIARRSVIASGFSRAEQNPSWSLGAVSSKARDRDDWLCLTLRW
ncbi:MAG: 50S ribosomal protein L11 methyltransferase [Bryobacteraceae bacterium]|nr:50S ribosomal protein L11 methyltransferase [Bryobacteraceae bacterium]MDW8379747.1 50S ribosomal protein L11 methyltransferase [Bryobacterales bacterium]